MSGSGSKGHAPSTPEQVAECQKLLEAHRDLQKVIKASSKWKIHAHNSLMIEGGGSNRIFLPGISWPRLHGWLHEEAARIKDELFNKFGIEVS